MAKDKGLENTKFIVQNELSLLYFLLNYLSFSLFIQHGFYRQYLHTWYACVYMYVLDYFAESVP